MHHAKPFFLLRDTLKSVFLSYYFQHSNLCYLRPIANYSEAFNRRLYSPNFKKCSEGSQLCTCISVMSLFLITETVENVAKEGYQCLTLYHIVWWKEENSC